MTFNARTNSLAYIGYMYNNVYFMQVKVIDESSEYLDWSLFVDTYIFGDSYTDNKDGTYTINNPTTITSTEEWKENYSSLNNKYTCKNAVNNTCRNLLYITRTDENTFG